MFAVERRNFANSVRSISNLLNYEGRIATYYWSVLSKIFNSLSPDFHFTKRGSKWYSWNTNAADEVNALLNYGYAILETEVRKDINAIGLDPTIGFLHELAQSKTPLVMIYKNCLGGQLIYVCLAITGRKETQKGRLYSERELPFEAQAYNSQIAN